MKSTKGDTHPRQFLFVRLLIGITQHKGSHAKKINNINLSTGHINARKSNTDYQGVHMGEY